MTDAEFVAAFESCELPTESFRHREHLRLAWLYLERVPYEEAVRLMEQSIRRYAAHHGAPTKYHHTITLLWMRLVAAANANGKLVTFDDLLSAHADLLDKEVPKRFYSDDVLNSAEARTGWVEPDLQPLPDLPTNVRETTALDR